MAVIQQFLNFATLGRFFGRVYATGGTIIDSDGYRIHVFTGTGPFNVAGGGEVEYLVVAGGGGSSTAGGGAGGFRTGNSFIVESQNYTITVGGGGDPSSPNGGDSVFSTITSTGGGRAGYVALPGGYGAAPGGSGGGGGVGVFGASMTGGLGNTPPVSPPQGNPGGTTPDAGSAGGGGAGVKGTDGTTNCPGGDGLPVSWVPASYGTPGPSPGRWFAGGGGGGPAGTGGAGGGGSAGSTGSTNTGGGGGGGFPYNSGGSGIVIIRYPI